MKFVLTIITALLLLLSTNLRSQENEFSQKFNDFIVALMDSIPEIPAIAVTVVKDDAPVFLRAYGMSDKENGIKADENTLFYIASSTKSFTALTAALMDSEGIIKVSDPMINYCDGIIFKNPIPDKITIQDLLIHTSGLENEPLTFRVAYSGNSDHDELCTVFAEASTFIDSSYGKYHYDNLGYNIYALLLENRFGRKWRDEIQTRIFDLLGMSHSTAYISRAPANNWSVAVPYVWMPEGGVVRSWLEKKDNNMQSAGGLYSSISDMSKWINLNINKGRLNGVQLIPENTIKKCQTGYTTTLRDQQPFTGQGEYGLGWQIGKYKNEKVIYHNGGFPGYASHVSFLPEKKVGVVVMINESSAGNRAIHLLAEYAYNYFLNTENFDETFDARLNEFAANYHKLKSTVAASFKERSKRVSQLSKPVNDYTGNYYNPHLGNMEIYLAGEKNDQLGVRHGNMNCVATPFKEKESVRVELIPGSGETIYFKLKPDTNEVDALMYGDFRFEKVK